MTASSKSAQAIPAAETAHYLDILRHNHGFDDPAAWLDCAKRWNFKRVGATPVSSCPHCGRTRSTVFGQFVYYSSLLRVNECGSCKLLYVDAHLDDDLIRDHFERAYKDEVYFERSRSAVFAQVTALASEFARPGNTVIDIGGAQGHLLSRLKRERPDLNLILADLSANACKYASDTFGLRTICEGSVKALREIGRADVALLIDVVYYEPALQELWQTLRDCIRPGGVVVIRIPNTVVPIRMAQRVRHAVRGRNRQQTRMPFLNPEHIYIISWRFLARALGDSGFEQIRFHSSRLLGSRRVFMNVARTAWYLLSAVVQHVTSGRIILTPSVLVTAVRRGDTPGQDEPHL